MVFGPPDAALGGRAGASADFPRSLRVGGLHAPIAPCTCSSTSVCTGPGEVKGASSFVMSRWPTIAIVAADTSCFEAEAHDEPAFGTYFVTRVPLPEVPAKTRLSMT